MDRVEIALAANETYFSGLVVTAGSIALHASQNVILSFHICDGGIPDAKYQNFCNLISSKHSHVEFTRHKINETVFKQFPKWQGNHMAYARLLLDNLMPESEHVIYCDVDFLWMADIAKLWQLRDNKSALISVPDSCKETLEKEEKWFKSHRLPFDKRSYVCSGLTFFNLRLMRQMNLREKIYHWLEKYPDVIFPDQAALNSILFAKIRLIPSYWQQLTVTLKQEDFDQPIVLHYAGESPWKRRLWIEMLTDTILLWHKYNAKIHSKTLWWSLRQYFSIWEIFYRRAIFELLSKKLTRKIFFWLLDKTGRSSYIQKCLQWCNYFPRIISKKLTITRGL
jgi:hypothetical protein